VGTRTQVAVVVLSWNGREDTLACLDSLRRVEHEPLSVIVVDNASVDGTADAVAARHPEAELVRNAANLGYAGGMNAGIRRARELGADHVLLLNNDTEVDATFVGALVEAAAAHPDAGALCAKVLFAEPADRIWFAGADYDPRRPARRGPLRLRRGRRVVAARPRAGPADPRRRRQPGLAQGVGGLGRGGLADRAVLHAAQRPGGRRAPRAAGGGRDVAAAARRARGDRGAGAAGPPAHAGGAARGRPGLQRRAGRSSRAAR
jgi:Glycosyl transferase family 2